MADTTEAPRAARPRRWRSALPRAWTRLRAVAPFASGVAAALLAVYLFSALNPPAQPLTIGQVNSAVAKAMASATPAPARSAQAYRAVMPSLVLVQAVGKDASGKEDKRLGSGVLVSDRGEILTALHVADGADTIKVVFADGTETGARIASSMPESDVAVLQPEQLPRAVVPAVLGNPNAVREGDEAFAVGSPFGLYGSISAGVVSGLDREFQAPGSDQTIRGLIQIDTAVNPGSSGGPLVNRSGQVIGIVIGILNPTEEEFFVGVGFAVPITTAASGGGRPPQY